MAWAKVSQVAHGSPPAEEMPLYLISRHAAGPTILAAYATAEHEQPGTGSKDSGSRCAWTTSSAKHWAIVQEPYWEHSA